MLRLFPIVLLVLALATLTGCPQKKSEPEAPAVDAGGAVAVAPAPDAAAAAAPVVETEISWRFQPATLDVYRDTRVTFSLELDTPAPASWRCSWDFGDGSPLAEGCHVEHLYRGGHSDQLATLTVREGEREIFVGSRKVPLERLPVVPMGDDDEGVARDLSIPPPPREADTSFRFVVVSDSAAPPHAVARGTQVRQAISAIVERVRPDFVIHNGNMVAVDSDEKRSWNAAWKQFHEDVTRRLSDVGIPLVPAPGDRDAGNARPAREVFRAQWKRPENRPRVTLLDDEAYPLRYAFSHKGAHFLIMDGATGAMTEKQLRWLRRQLDAASIYNLRFVFSHVPLHKFADLCGTAPRELDDEEQEGADAGGLEKHFRIYNMLLEHNVSLFVSSHHEVYFKGRYGALRVVSTGNISGARQRLSGQTTPQEPSFVVVDVEGGRLKHVFAVAGPDYDRRLDEDGLPDEVEVYRYDPTFTPGLRMETPPAGLLSP